MNDTKIKGLISFIEEEAKKQKRPTSTIIREISEAFAATPWQNYEPGMIINVFFDEKCENVENITDLIREHIERSCEIKDFAIIDKIINCNDEDIQLINENSFIEYTTDGGYHYFFDQGMLNYCTMLKGQSLCLFIDREGYHYNRCMCLPGNWREMYADEFQTVLQEQAIKNAKDILEEAQEAAKAKAAYQVRAEKYEKYLTPVEQPQSWDDRKGIAKAWNQTKKNIVAMLSADFPGVKFTIKKGSWRDFSITWTDGPTKNEVKNKTDLQLLMRKQYETAGPCDDYGHWNNIDYCPFAEKYTTSYNKLGGYELDRQPSESTLDTIIEDATALFEWDNAGYMLTTEENKNKILQYTNREGILNYIKKRDAAFMLFEKLSLYTEPRPTSRRTSGGSGTPAASTSPAATEQKAAPALELVTIPQGIAITGNTYPHRREIKAIGCRWNKAAQRWEATTPQAVQALREWFRSQHPTDPDPTPDPGNDTTANTDPSSQKTTPIQ